MTDAKSADSKTAPEGNAESAQSAAQDAPGTAAAPATPAHRVAMTPPRSAKPATITDSAPPARSRKRKTGRGA